MAAAFSAQKKKGRNFSRKRATRTNAIAVSIGVRALPMVVAGAGALPNRARALPMAIPVGMDAVRADAVRTDTLPSLPALPMMIRVRADALPSLPALPRLRALPKVLGIIIGLKVRRRMCRCHSTLSDKLPRGAAPLPQALPRLGANTRTLGSIPLGSIPAGMLGDGMGSAAHAGCKLGKSLGFNMRPTASGNGGLGL